MDHTSDRNRDLDGSLIDVVQAIEAVNPPGTSFEVLNNLPQIQKLACAVGFNATNIFPEDSPLKNSAIHYMKKMASVLKQVFIDLQKKEPFKTTLSDISPESLENIHYIVLLKSLLNWLAIVNFIEFTKEVVLTENKETASQYCLFMFNLLKAKSNLRTQKFYRYRLNITSNYQPSFQDDPLNLEDRTNTSVLKQLIKDALRREALYPVIVFLVFLLNDMIHVTSNPQQNFTPEERFEILQVAKQSNSPEKQKIIRMLLKSLKAPI